MQYNGLVADNDEYYTKVMDWITRNGLSIDTRDMVKNDSRKQRRLAIGAF